MNRSTLEYALGKLMDIEGNGEIRLEILRFTRQKTPKTGSEDIALAFRISRGEEMPHDQEKSPAGAAAGTDTEKETGTAAGNGTGTAAETETGIGTGKEAGTADKADIPASPAHPARNCTEIMEA